MLLREMSSARVAAVAALFLSLSLAPQLLLFAVNQRSTDKVMSRRDVASAEAVRRIKAAEGVAFVNDADLALHAGIQPSFEQHPFSILAHAGRWDAQPLADAIGRKKFSVIESSFDLAVDPIPVYQGIKVWPESVVRAARKSYCLTWSAPLLSEVGNGFWLYEPCR
jgi:hypothetical protein